MRGLRRSVSTVDPVLNVLPKEAVCPDCQRAAGHFHTDGCLVLEKRLEKSLRLDKSMKVEMPDSGPGLGATAPAGGSSPAGAHYSANCYECRQGMFPYLQNDPAGNEPTVKHAPRSSFMPAEDTGNGIMYRLKEEYLTKDDTPKPGESSMRRFVLVRKADPSQYSGTGVVVEGVQFSDGRVVMRWLGDKSSIVIWPNIQMALDVHGHGGDTEVQWQDA